MKPLNIRDVCSSQLIVLPESDDNVTTRGKEFKIERKRGLLDKYLRLEIFLGLFVWVWGPNFIYSHLFFFKIIQMKVSIFHFF